MCGICGFVGQLNEKAVNNMILANETRGGHAWGAAWRESGQIMYFKEPGAFKNSSFKIPGTDMLVAHTRWATHGKPEQNENNHPHVGGGLVLVHNGVVSNRHPNQKTICDSEAILKMIISHDHDNEQNTTEAIKKTCEKIDGSFRIAVMNTKCPGRIWIACDRDDPVYFGYGRGFIAFASEEKDLPKGCAPSRAIGGHIYIMSTKMEMKATTFKVPDRWEQYTFKATSQGQSDWGMYRKPITTTSEKKDEIFPYGHRVKTTRTPQFMAGDECEYCKKTHCGGCPTWQRIVNG